MKLQALYKNMWFPIVQRRQREEEVELLLYSRNQYKVDIWVSTNEIEEVREIGDNI